ncbi:MAG: hypothetical protein LBC28_04510 [Oscillospiraceae bacterium]|jgi:hypothetical protein|nr:hypothetical protein [Oscillospiraceae bacterium]
MTKRPRARGNAFINLITFLLFSAFSLYFGSSLYKSYEDPFLTVTAAVVTLSETAEARGFIVREEQIIPGGAGLVTPRLGDGEKAANGQLVAELYRGADSETASRLGELELRIKRLREAAAIAPEERERQSADAVAELAYSLARRELGEARELAVRAESLIMGAPNADDAREEISALETELSSLKARLSGGDAVYAPKAGVYARLADGFEGVTSSSVMGLSPAGLEALFAYPSGDAGAGRLVTGARWYLAVIADGAALNALLEKDSVTVRLTKPRRAEFTMRVEDVGKSDGEKRVAVLSCSYGISEILNTRACDAELIYGETSGIRAPREAIRLEPASPETPEQLDTFVYIVEGHRAKRVRVEILREVGGAYIVKGEMPEGTLPGASSVLRDGVEIIVKANGLYDGKVVR